MSAATGGVSTRALLLLVVLTLVWGTNWPLFPLAVKEVSVWTFRGVALLIAGTSLLVVAKARGLSLHIPRHQWTTVILATFTYLVIWNICSTYAAVLIPSGQAAILGFTMPLWLALIGWALRAEPMTSRQWLAVGLGAVAVGLLLYDGIDAYRQAPLGFALGLLAGLGWAVGTLVLKRQPLGCSALVLTGWQLLGAALPIIIGALWLAEGPWFWPSGTSVAVITYIALVPMCIGNLAWFSIVGMLPANIAGLSSISVPVVAMISGAFLHGEPLGPLQWGAVACCVGGLSLALLRPAATR
jgi:drug/metabolite transporter (DMT)-like permease